MTELEAIKEELGQIDHRLTELTVAVLMLIQAGMPVNFDLGKLRMQANQIYKEIKL